jgi:hypothetical protein
MAGVPALSFEKYWQKETEALRAAYKRVMASHPEAKKAMEKAYEVVTDIAQLAGCTPKEVSEGKEWVNIVKRLRRAGSACAGRWKGKSSSAPYTVYICSPSQN